MELRDVVVPNKPIVAMFPIGVGCGETTDGWDTASVGCFGLSPEQGVFQIGTRRVRISPWSVEFASGLVRRCYKWNVLCPTKTTGKRLLYSARCEVCEVYRGGKVVRDDGVFCYASGIHRRCSEGEARG